MIDKLTPAPWTFSSSGRIDDYGYLQSDMEFIALARNAFDVMMRRGWCVAILENGRWQALPSIDATRVVEFENLACDGYADPFTALVEADKWYKENVEKP